MKCKMKRKGREDEGRGKKGGSCSMFKGKLDKGVKILNHLGNTDKYYPSYII